MTLICYLYHVFCLVINHFVLVNLHLNSRSTKYIAKSILNLRSTAAKIYVLPFNSFSTTSLCLAVES